MINSKMGYVLAERAQMGTALEGSPCTSPQSQFNTNKPNFDTIALIVAVSLGLLVSLCPCFCILLCFYVYYLCIDLLVLLLA